MKLQNIKWLISLALSPLFVDCGKSEVSVADQGDITVQLSHHYSNALAPAMERQSTNPTETESTEKVRTLKYFICDGGLVTTLSENFASEDGSFKLQRSELTPTSKIYVVANDHLIPQGQAIAQGSQESLLTNLSTSQSGDNGQIKGLVMSAVSSLSEAIQGRVLDLQMRRNLARFDLNIQQNVGIEVVSITIDGLATASSVFDQYVVPSENKATYVSHFQSPVTETIKGLFYAHPRVVGLSAATARLKILYHGNLVTLEKTIGQIKRNYIHRISLAANLGSIDLNISDSPMETGDSDDPINSDLTIRLDKVQSQPGEGATISTDAMRINLPYWGNSSVIVLDAAPGVSLESVQGKTDDFAITPLSPDGLSYQITTSANIRQGNDKKAIVLNFLHPNDNHNNHYRIIVSIDNCAAFPMVSFNNLDWMTYNAIGKNPNLYPLLTGYNDVRDIYKRSGNWSTFMGGGWQWGPRPGKNGVQIMVPQAGVEAYGYAALPTINGNIIGGNATAIWQETTTPCPNGWRVPTYDEYQTIWPPNGTILKENAPTEYTTTKGNTLSAVIETFGGSYKTNITGGADVYADAKNLIISKDNFEIIFPITGFRVANGTFRHANGGLVWNGLGLHLGTETYYWCANKFNANYIAVGLQNKVSQNNTNNRNHNVWYSVRCVRPHKQ